MVDLFEVHDAGLVADRFDERAEAQVAGAAQQTLARPDDERQRFGGEGVVASRLKVLGAIWARVMSPASMHSR
ncbi:MAG: hypothetical protein WCH99_01790 [Verrucomicrobiota bacterium]